jgi:hypothetical protein
MMAHESKFLVALGLTVTIETVVLVLLVRLVFRMNVPYTQTVFAGIFASFATLPYLWFIVPWLMAGFKGAILTGEIIVTILEAVILCFILKTGIKKAALLSVACNVTSFLTGLLIYY